MSKKIEIIILLIGVAIILIIGLYNLNEFYCLTIINDEFSYWANAAQMAGKDWVNILSTSDFYSYGYSFILVPLYWLKLPMTIVYQIAIVINVLMLVASFLLTVWLGIRLFGDGGGFISRPIIIYISLVVTLYVGNIFQLTIAWTEIPLYFMVWVIAVFMYKVINPILGKEKPKYIDITMLALAAVYIYTIHNRALGILITAFALILFHYIKSLIEKSPQHRLTACLLLMIGLFICATIFRQYTIENWYNPSLDMNEGVQSNIADPNDFSNQASKFKRLMTFEGIIELILSFAGKLYYQAAASFLLIFLPLFSSVGMTLTAIFSKFKRKKRRIYEKWDIASWLIFFCSAAFMFEIGIAAIYKSGPFDTLRTVDVLYGRYPEFAIGPILLFAFALILMKWNLIKEVAIGAVIYLICAVLVGYQLENVYMMFLNVNNAPGVYNFFRSGNTNLIVTLIMTLVGLAGFVLVAGCALLVQMEMPEKWPAGKVKRISRDIIMTCITIIGIYWFVTGVNIAEGWVMRNSEGARATMTPIEDAMAKMPADTEVFYVIPPGESLHNYIMIYRSLDPDRIIHVMTHDEINADRPNEGHYVFMSRMMEVSSDDLVILVDTGGLILFVDRDSAAHQYWMYN